MLKFDSASHKNRPARRVIALALIMAGPLFAAPWELQKNEEGIRISTRKRNGTSLKEYRAEMTVKTTVKEVHDLLEDTARAKKWIDRLKVSQVIKNISPTDTVTLTVSAAPWPLKDRETVSLSHMHIDKNGMLNYENRAVTGYVTPHQNRVRIYDMNASWRATPLENGQVKIVHQAWVDPGGVIPAWLLNMFVVEMPFKTMKNFRRELLRQ